ncbi:hypothetical protein ACIA49_17225 [Kribbella sp. NPDC051587]
MSDPVVRGAEAERVRARAAELWPSMLAALQATSALADLGRRWSGNWG